MNEIILLQQIEDTVSLYANCVKKGYRTLHYLMEQGEVHTLQVTRPEIIIRNLLPGDYYMYAENEKGQETGHLSFTVSGLKKETVFQNILTCVGLQEEINYSLLTSEDYIIPMYRLYKNGKVTEEALQAFTSFYNARQEELNTTSLPEFILRQYGSIQIQGQFHIPYRFVPYKYDFTTDTWKLLKEQSVFNEENYTFTGKPLEMYQILVLSDFSLVRRYFHYQASETASETILERRIQTKRLKTEQTTELITQLNLETIADDTIGQETVVTMQHIASDHYIFAAPEVEIDETVISVNIPDYAGIKLCERDMYLAALELTEVFAEKPVPHKYKIGAATFQVKASDLLLNSDTEYLFYITDNKNALISDFTLISLNPDFAADTYTDAYLRTVYDTYIRKLNSVFKEYDRNSWNTISQLLEQYLLIREKEERPYSFLLKRILRLDENRYRIDKLIEIVILCQLRHYASVDSNFLSHQVYSKEFRSHVFPESDRPYIVRAEHINGDTVTREYFLTGDESLSIRMDKDDFLLLQCIDPETWSVSSPAFYNNRIKTGAPYFYFPKLEVEVI